MQVDIRTTSITPLRQTFAHIERRIGPNKAASRYQEATYDLQPEVNFHYRPLWQPELALYDKRRTQVVMADWYALKDPRQFYYGTYTMTRARQQDATEKHFEFADRKGVLRYLPEALRARLTFCLVPLRHVEWAANTNNSAIAAYGWGTAITQAAMFHTMDRLGLAQYLSRIGLMLDGNQGKVLDDAKQMWLEHADLQGLRRRVEDQMVIEDWFELHVAQNLVLDGLLFPLVYQRFDTRLAIQIGPILSLCLEFFSNWFDETRRWVDATIKPVVAESAANAERVSAWYQQSRDATAAALVPYLAHLFADDGVHELEQALAALDERAAKLGIAVGGRGVRA